MYASKQRRKEGNGRSSGSGGERIGMLSTSMLAEEWRKRKGDGDEEGCGGGKDVVDWTGRGRWSQWKYARSGGSRPAVWAVWAMSSPAKIATNVL